MPRLALLDPTRTGTQAEDLEKKLRHLIIGQDEAIHQIVRTYQTYLAGLSPVGRPIGNFLFLGPTGSGKTRTVEATAEALVGNPGSVTKIDCAEFQHSHEIAKLIGSPPGYLGHRETRPVLSQETLNQHHTDSVKLSFLLFDEIEKASDALWNLLLGILDKATLTLGDNRRVDFSQTLIFLTSNLGGRAITDLMSDGFGFVRAPDKPTAKLDEQVKRTAVEAARRKFSPEFMNRLDKVVVFHPLRREQLQEVLNIELGQVQQRVLDTAKGQFLFRVTPSGRDFLLQEGTDQRYGARHLKRAIERHVVYPLANLLATDQVNLGDLVCIDWDKTNNRLTFVREGEGALVEAAAKRAGAAAAGAEATDGKFASAPEETVTEEKKTRAAQPGAAPAAAPQSRKKQDRSNS